MKEMAEANIQISEAKNTLFKVQEEETEYLVAREEKALVKIQKVLEDSTELLTQTYENYEEIHSFLRTVSEYAKFIKDTHQNFQQMLAEFHERNAEWDKEAELEHEKAKTLKREIKIDKIQIENDRKSIERGKKLLAEERIKIEDERSTLKRAVERLKDNKI